jgi:hypothetical protein
MTASGLHSATNVKPLEKGRVRRRYQAVYLLWKKAGKERPQLVIQYLSIFLQSNGEDLPLLRSSSGRLKRSVWQAGASISTRLACSKPACSKPRACPPAPAQISIELNGMSFYVGRG